MDLPSVVLTRSRADNAPLAAALRARGVAVRELACSAVRLLAPRPPPAPWQALVFSSRHGVRGFLAAGLRCPQGCLVASVGPATARALRGAGLEPGLVAAPPSGAVLGELLAARLERGARVVWACGARSAGGLEPALEAAGLRLVRMQVYANDAPPLAACAPFPTAAVFCAAPSAGERLLQACPWLRGAPFFCIGATTAEALRGLGVASCTALGAEREVWVEALEEAWRRARG